MRSHKDKFRNNTTAVSEVIGELLMTAIAVLAFSVIAVFVLSYAGSPEKVHADIQGWVDADTNTIYLRHAGGQTIDIPDTRIMLNVNGTMRELSPTEVLILKGSSIWQLGEVVSINVSSLWGDSITPGDHISTTILSVSTNMVIKSGTLLGYPGHARGGSGNVTPPVEPPQPVVPFGQVAWWKLNENTGTIAYDSIGAYNGTVFEANRVTGVSGNALDFDGTNDHVQINNRIIENYPFTISVWLKTTNCVSTPAVVNLAYSGASNSYYGIDVTSAGVVRLVARNTNTRNLNGIQINDGQWHHIAAVYSSANDRTLYVDGVNRGYDNQGTPFNVNANRWSFGRWGDSSPSNYLNGSIDEVRLWNRALNSTEVQQLYMNP